MGRTWRVLAALVLATAALGVLSIQAVRREAAVRRSLVVDAHRGLADLVSARLSVALADDEHAVAAAIEASDRRADTLVDALGEIEAARPWMRPLAVVRSTDRDPESSAGDSRLAGSSQTATAFDSLLHAAEREELTLRRFDVAVGLYAKAAAVAPSPARRLEALNGMARTELRASRPRQAAEAWETIVAAADNLDPDQVRWAMIARDRLIECDAVAGDPIAQRQHALDFYAFLVRFRYVLESDVADFYTRRVIEAIDRAHLTPAQQERRQGLRDRETLLAPFDAAVRSASLSYSAGPRAAVAYPLHLHVEAVLQRILREPGPWSERGIALVDAAGGQLFSSVKPRPADATAASVPLAQPPNWRVLAFPRSGSLDDVAARDVNRYALWLVLVFGTVVAALALAARSVSRELALSRLRGEFVASVSHELKTPLSLIRMFGESLREGWVAEPQKKDYYEVITRESERLTGLINNVLDFSRLESGTRRYTFDMVDLRQLINDLLDRYEFHLRAASIDLVRNLPAQAVHARADRDAIEQVIVNLLSNAVKYMGDPAKQPRQVRVSLERDDHHVVLRVSDTGIGMSDAHRPHIFERFYRSDDERVRAVAGSGLGLTLVKAHVDAHAGTIAVDSVPGHGSTFAISLPLATEGAKS